MRRGVKTRRDEGGEGSGVARPPWGPFTFFPVASKWRNAAPFPPLPSQFCLPEPMKPVLRLSHRFSVTPVSSHFHFEGSEGIV